VIDGGGTAAIDGVGGIEPALMSSLGIVTVTWGLPLSVVAIRRRHRRRGSPAPPDGHH
jgi:hypothetical protein